MTFLRKMCVIFWKKINKTRAHGSASSSLPTQPTRHPPTAFFMTCFPSALIYGVIFFCIWKCLRRFFNGLWAFLPWRKKSITNSKINRYTCIKRWTSRKHRFVYTFIVAFVPVYYLSSIDTNSILKDCVFLFQKHCFYSLKYKHYMLVFHFDKVKIKRNRRWNIGIESFRRLAKEIQCQLEYIFFTITYVHLKKRKYRCY